MRQSAAKDVAVATYDEQTDFAEAGDDRQRNNKDAEDGQREPRVGVPVEQES